MVAETYPSSTVRMLLKSDLVTPQTRKVLEARLERSATKLRFFDAETFATLRSACARLIPQAERPEPIELAAAVDERLADGDGNGWRYAALPPDGEAYRLGLHGLEETAQAMFGAGFTTLGPERQDEILLAVQRGKTQGEAWQVLPSGQFFEELLAELTECYYSHPLAQEEIGYVGMADAHGWQAIGLDRLEPREPQALENHHD